MLGMIKVEAVGADLLSRPSNVGPKPDGLDVEVFVNRGELFLEGDELFLASATRRRSSPESLTINIRAVSGCERIKRRDGRQVC